MNSKLRHSYIFQLSYLGILSGLVFSADYFFGLNPRLRMNFETLIEGALASFPIVLMLGFFYTTFTYLAKERTFNEFTLHIEAVKQLKFEKKISHALCRSVSEELFIRTLIFSQLMLLSSALAYTVNAIVSVAFRLSQFTKSFIVIPTLIECSLLAYLYSQRKSAFMLIITHFLCKIFWDMTFSSSWFSSFIVKIRTFKRTTFHLQKQTIKAD